MSDERFSPGRLLGFLREKKSLWFIIAALLLGAALMMFGGGGATVGKSSETALEARIKSFCEQVGGVSNVSVLVTLDPEGKVCGAAVVCSGGDDPVVQLKLTRLLCSLYGITSDSVSVIGGRE